MLESISDCPRNFTTIQCGVYPVNRRFPQNFQMISTSGIFWERESCTPKTNSRFLTGLSARLGMTRFLWGRSRLRATVWSSDRDGTPLSAHAFKARRFCDSPDGRQEIEKRSYLLGGPCFEGTLRMFNAFRMKSRGRDD